MKVTYIEIEATAQELASTRTVAESLVNTLNRVFNRMSDTDEIEEEDAEEVE